MSEFIGSRVSLISKSDIRYNGILHEVNSQDSTIAVKNVRSFGTEGRKGNPAEEVPPSDALYSFIVFRGSDVKDLKIESGPEKDSAPPPQPPLNDPAIMGMQMPGQPPQGQAPNFQGHPPFPGQPPFIGGPPGFPGPYPGFGGPPQWMPPMPGPPGGFQPPFHKPGGPHPPHDRQPGPAGPSKQPPAELAQPPPKGDVGEGNGPKLPLASKPAAPATAIKPQTAAPQPVVPNRNGQRTEVVAKVSTVAAEGTNGAQSSAQQAASALQNSTQAAAAAVAAAMAKLPPVNKSAGDVQQRNDQSYEARSNQASRGRGRGRGGHQGHKKLDVPTTAFDFEEANAKFSKLDIKKEAIASGSPLGEATPTSGTEDGEIVIPKPSNEGYNKASSFFDNISSETKERAEAHNTDQPRPGGPQWRGEERKRNIETFGQGSVDTYRGHRGRGRGRGRGQNWGGRGGNRGRGQGQGQGQQGQGGRAPGQEQAA